MSNRENVDHIKIWERVRKGDAAAFEKLYSDYARMLYDYGLKFTSNTQLIEDCIQELYTRMIQNHSNLGYTDNINGYLVGSFRNNIIRMLAREQKYALNEIDHYTFEVQYSIENNIIESEQDQNRRTRVTQALAKLTSRQKEAIFLKYTSGFEYSEIAGIMQISTKACRNIISKAIKSLRENVHITHINKEI